MAAFMCIAAFASEEKYVALAPATDFAFRGARRDAR
jgi:hypothetical protein